MNITKCVWHFATAPRTGHVSFPTGWFTKHFVKILLHFSSNQLSELRRQKEKLEEKIIEQSRQKDSAKKKYCILVAQMPLELESLKQFCLNVT